MELSPELGTYSVIGFSTSLAQGPGEAKKLTAIALTVVK